MLNENPSDEILVTLSDFFRPLVKSWKIIVISGIIFGVLSCGLTLTRNPRYTVEASFRERGTAKEQVSGHHIKHLLMGNDSPSSGNETVTTMTSQNLIGRLVRKLNLHGTITPIGERNGLFTRISNNLKVELSYLRKSPYPTLLDKDENLFIENLIYEREVPLKWEVTFHDNNQFTVIDKKGVLVGNGEIGKRFIYNDIAFTLYHNNLSQLKGRSHILTMSPPISITRNLANKISILTDPKDASLIKIAYTDTDRHRSCKIVNSLMEVYQEYLHDENSKTTNEQIAYLKKREDSVGNTLRKMMYEHAESISSDIFQSGYPSSGLAMEYLFTTQTELKTKLTEVDLEVARVETAIKEGYDYYERHHPLDVTTMYPELIKNIRELKKEADTLDLSLRHTLPQDSKVLNQLFILQYAELENIHGTSLEAHALLSALQKGNRPLPPIDLLDTPRYMVRTWLEKLGSTAHEKTFGSPTNERDQEKEHENTRAGFTAYLKNLVHLLEVNEKTIKEKLAHQQNPYVESKGVDLKLTKKMSHNHHVKLSDLETKAIENQFILKQINTPGFEISSLSGILTDPVSMQIISKAGNLTLEIDDEQNRTSREQSRLKNELGVQKKFLAQHIEQTIQLQKIQQKIITNKIKALQASTLHHTQQEISLLEKHLNDYFQTRLNSLHEEKKNILKAIAELNQELSSLPEKWIQEKLIEHHMLMGQRMVEQVSHLVESKNLASNLELIQSAPLDIAIAPINPKRPNVFLFSLAGAFVGMFLGICFVITRSVIEGITASENNLKLAGLHTSGKISRHTSYTDGNPSKDQDLATLRRLMGYMNESDATEDNMIVLVTGNNTDYSHTVASLYAKSGEKVLLVPFCFDKPATKVEVPGILQYLEGEVDTPKVLTEQGYSRITAGGITRYGSELISSPKFQNLIDSYREQYDRILAISHASPTSAEAEKLISRYNHVAITLSGEQIEQLATLIHYGRQKNKRITFLFSDDV